MPTRRAAAAASQTIEVPMQFKKSTSGTHCFEAVEDDAAITTQYIRKSAFENPVTAETTITVTVAVS